MVRRAVLDRDGQIAADDEVMPAGQPPAVNPGQVTAHWRGAGGRWLVWAARAVAWAVLILIGYRGVLAIFQGNDTAKTPAASHPVAHSTQFPVTMAEAYALEFGDAYLNFSPSSAAQRARTLAEFLPPGADSQLGWNGAGTQRLLAEQVASVSVTSSKTAVVTLLARLSNGLIEVGVPIYAADGAMSVSGDPALLPGPAKASPPQQDQASADQATETALQDQLAAFFQAYASGDQATLDRFAAPGAHITGLGGTAAFDGIDSVYAPDGGSTRQISVTVTWQFPALRSTGRRAGSVAGASAAMQMTYQMTVVSERGSWDVRSIGALTESLAQGPP